MEHRNENKMAAARLGFELSVLTTISERADVGDGPGGEQDPAQTPLTKGGPLGSY